MSESDDCEDGNVFNHGFKEDDLPSVVAKRTAQLVNDMPTVACGTGWYTHHSCTLDTLNTTKQRYAIAKRLVENMKVTTDNAVGAACCGLYCFIAMEGSPVEGSPGVRKLTRDRGPKLIKLFPWVGKVSSYLWSPPYPQPR
jgi:hypothetical protein